MPYLTVNFTLEELTATQHRLIDNTPPAWVKENLERLADELEAVRKVLRNRPILVSSGYRSPELNKAVGGSKSSRHMQGLAADFICPSFGSPYEVCNTLAGSDLEFDQVIYEYGRWCHYGLALSGNEPRRMLLSIHRPGRYESGIVAR